ncbi:MAG: CotH kinase family protein [Verrucomicrobiota bacterium]
MGPRVLSSQNEVLQDYPYSGSYAWQDREVEVAVEFFETNRTVGFRQRAGMKIFGGWGSRGYPQKSLALFARRAYGAGKFNHRVFPDQDLDEFEALVLRNSGNDNQGTQQTPPRPPISAFGRTEEYGSYFVNSQFTLMRDALMQRLIRSTGLDTQAYRPAVVYFNGEYWGIYNLREKMNEDYVAAHHGLQRGGIDLIEGYGAVNAGSGTVYNQMRQFFSSKDLSTPANYAAVAEQYLDLDNFIDYHVAVIYFQNFDIGNIKCWRPRAARGLFRWLVFDQDYGFNLWPPGVYLPAMARDYADYANMFDFYTSGSGSSTAWPNGGGRTLMLRSLLKNSQFRARFIRRAADMLNTVFREETVEQNIQAMAAVIRPEIPAHLQRWSWRELSRRGFGRPHQAEYQPFLPETWETNLNVLTAFGRTRPAQLREDCQVHFKLNGGLGPVQVQVEPAGSGRIILNSLTLDSFPWRGVYFVDITNQVQALPYPGYRFRQWNIAGTRPDELVATFNVGPNRTNSVTALFEPAPDIPNRISELALTEIQYHPGAGADSGDWVELGVTGSAPVHLSGWIFRDGGDDHAFALPDIELAPGDRLVLCQDEARFRLFHPATVPVSGSFQFGLDNSGGRLRLFRPDGTLALSMSYNDTADWPTGADGGGATLQLVNLQGDPNLPASWRASAQTGGSPGTP